MKIVKSFKLRTTWESAATSQWSPCAGLLRVFFRCCCTCRAQSILCMDLKHLQGILDCSLLSLLFGFLAQRHRQGGKTLGIFHSMISVFLLESQNALSVVLTASVPFGNVAEIGLVGFARLSKGCDFLGTIPLWYIDFCLIIFTSLVRADRVALGESSLCVCGRHVVFVVCCVCGLFFCEVVLGEE